MDAAEAVLKAREAAVGVPDDLNENGGQEHSIWSIEQYCPWWC